MRAPYWAISLILVLSLLACNDLYSPPGKYVEEGDDGITYTDVVYSPDGKSLTLYLEGSVPVPNRQRRALSKELAIAGHDYFEVAFYWQQGDTPNPATDIIARTSWELMADAQIKGVRGKGAGESVRYISTALWEEHEYPDVEIIGWTNDEPPVPITIPVTRTTLTPALDPGQGAAILFVGRKTDKTLLGVGKLILVDGVAATLPTTSITPATKTVTFEVAALECGLTSNNSAENSFWTNFHGSEVNDTNTRRELITMNGLTFDIFKLRDLNEGGSNITSGQYHFRTNGADIDDYRLGIILADGGVYERKQPRYPTANGQFQYFPVVLDDKTEITSSNNLVSNKGTPFRNPLNLVFNTRYTLPGTVFALAFQIPVCPLYLNEEAGTWYIRASYDSYWLDLDPGINVNAKGAGGAILFSTGTPTEASAYQIRVIAPPYKWLYSYHDDVPLHAGNPNGNPDPDIAGSVFPSDRHPVNRYFNVDGMVVALEVYNGGEPGEFIRYLNNSELSFEIGMKSIKPRRMEEGVNIAGDPLPVTVYSLQTVKVIYFHKPSMVNHESAFHIIVDNSDRRFTGIPNSGIPPTPALAVNQNETTLPGFPTNADYFPGSGIPMRNFLVINNLAVDYNNLQGFLNQRLNYAGKQVTTFVIIFDSTQGPPAGGTNYNFNNSQNMAPFNNSPNLIIMVAGRPTGSGDYYPQIQNAVHVGRGSGSLNDGVFNNEATANAFYVGKWPFNDYLFGVQAQTSNFAGLGDVARFDYTVKNPGDLDYVPGRVFHKTYNYTLDAYGPTTNNGSNAPTDPVSSGVGGKYFFRDFFDGRIYNVTVDPEITIYNRNWLF